MSCFVELPWPSRVGFPGYAERVRPSPTEGVLPMCNGEQESATDVWRVVRNGRNSEKLQIINALFRHFRIAQVDMKSNSIVVLLALCIMANGGTVV